MTITISSTEPSVIDRVLQLLRREEVPFEFHPTTIDKQTAWVKNQLTQKYVETGEWAKMDDEERQDAALLEIMLFTESDSDFETVSSDDAEFFIRQLQQGAL